MNRPFVAGAGAVVDDRAPLRVGDQRGHVGALGGDGVVADHGVGHAQDGGRRPGGRRGRPRARPHPRSQWPGRPAGRPWRRSRRRVRPNRHWGDITLPSRTSSGSASAAGVTPWSSAGRPRASWRPDCPAPTTRIGAPVPARGPISRVRANRVPDTPDTASGHVPLPREGNQRRPEARSDTAPTSGTPDSEPLVPAPPSLTRGAGHADRGPLTSSGPMPPPGTEGEARIGK